MTPEELLTPEEALEEFLVEILGMLARWGRCRDLTAREVRLAERIMGAVGTRRGLPGFSGQR